MRRPKRSVECSDSEKNMSAFADQNHAPSLTCVRLEWIVMQEKRRNIKAVRVDNTFEIVFLYYEKKYTNACEMCLTIQKLVEIN